jgi:hypothetical protein
MSIYRSFKKIEDDTVVAGFSDIPLYSSKGSNTSFIRMNLVKSSKRCENFVPRKVDKFHISASFILPAGDGVQFLLDIGLCTAICNTLSLSLSSL